ncbi:MAG: hypothetical protein JO224_04760 [Pelomonas sp.]|nr:hypothetical protein [Roseateles sp.]
MSSSRFSTLLLREWLQHKRGWLLTLVLPPVIFLVLLTFGEAHGLPDMPLAAGLLPVLMTMLVVLGIAAASIGFQLPGLARRDVQDRSIEFWLSLPASHSESLAATLLAHVLLVPLAAVALGFGAGFVIAAAFAVKMGGFAGLAAVPWGQVAALALPGALRVAAGVVLALVWAAPLILLTMAASAWFKRWSVAVIVGTLVLTCTILPKIYDFVLVRDWLRAQTKGAWNALLANPQQLADSPEQIAGIGSASAWQWAIADFVGELHNLASLQMLSGLTLAALGFYLLVLRRQRAG